MTRRAIKWFAPLCLPQLKMRLTCSGNQVDKPPDPHVREETACTAGRCVDAGWPSELVLKDNQNSQTRS